MATIAVLGMGLLGAGFAEALLGQGHTVRVWNRTASKCNPLVSKGAIAAASPAAAIADADRVHLVLSADAAVDAVLGAASPGPGTLVLDHSTNAPDLVARRYASLRDQGVRYLHAPVFMSPAAARAGTGKMLIAGPTDEVEELRPQLETLTGDLWHVGEDPDRAATIKLTGNGMLIALAGIMGDLYAIGRNNGLTPADTLELFERFTPTPTYIGNRVLEAGTKPASFELTMARKDVQLMLDAAGGREGLLVLPAVADALQASIDAGNGAEDFSIYASPNRPA